MDEGRHKNKDDVRVDIWGAYFLIWEAVVGSQQKLGTLDAPFRAILFEGCDIAYSMETDSREAVLAASASPECS